MPGEGPAAAVRLGGGAGRRPGALAGGRADPGAAGRGDCERGWLWCRRNPRLAGAIGAAAAALVAVAGTGPPLAAGQSRHAAPRPAPGADRPSSRPAGGREGRRTKPRRSGSAALDESNRRLAILNFERGQAACDRGVGPGLLWLVESWRRPRGRRPGWQQAARAAWLPGWPSPGIKAVFSHDRVSFGCLQPRWQDHPHRELGRDGAALGRRDRRPSAPP